jgi:hypothetical protein
MRENVRFAAAARDAGLRRVRRLTCRIGAAALAGSAVIAVAFSHLSGAASASGQSTGPGGRGAGTSPGAGAQSGGSQSSGSQSAGSQAGGSQAGGSQASGSRSGSSQPGGNSLEVPAQPVRPAQGPAQGVSGGS